MKTFVAAEFETEDFADLALGRVNNLCKVSEFRVLPNQNSDSDNHNDYILYYPYLNSVFYSIYPWPAVLEPRFILDSRGRSFHDGAQRAPHRRSRTLEVSVNTDSAARRVSEILVNAGGRNIKTAQK